MDESGPIKLPSANEFAPNIVGLLDVLKIVASNAGSREKIVDALRKRYFLNKAKAHSGDPACQEKMQRKLANNVCIGMSSYGLYDLKTNTLTEVGKNILACDDEQRAIEEFARHILRNLCGLQVISAIRQLQGRGETVKKETLAKELNQMGVVTPKGKAIPHNTTDHLKLLQWLRKAELLPDKGYEVNEVRFKVLTGLVPADVDEIRNLDTRKRIFLQVLKRHSLTNGKKPIFAKDIVAECRILAAPAFSKTDDLAKNVFAPLEQDGWIARTRVSTGRGGKSGQVAATDRLISLLPEDLYLGASDLIPAEIWTKLATPLIQIFEDLESDNTQKKGLALEILAVRMTYDLGLTPVKFRERSTVTGGAEVDLIAEGVHLHHSRWIIQCKNTKSVDVATLAKEIGLAILLKCHVVTLVTTGTFRSSVYEHARILAESSALQAVLIDRSQLERYRDRGALALYEYLQDRAKETLRLKKSQIEHI